MMGQSSLVLPSHITLNNPKTFDIKAINDIAHIFSVNESFKVRHDYIDLFLFISVGLLKAIKKCHLKAMLTKGGNVLGENKIHYKFFFQMAFFTFFF